MSKTFCVMPWLGLEINNNGNMRPCCAWNAPAVYDENEEKFNVNTHSIEQYHTSAQLDRVREALLRGEAVSECSKCYHEEGVGIRSMRVRKNAVFTHDVTEDGSLKSVDIKLSNLCNQKCVICNATASSMVAAENKDAFPELMRNFKYADFNWYKNEQRWEELKEIAHTVQHLDFYGGEPWLIKKQWEFIRYLVENGLSTHISINYATNGSVFDRVWFEEYFPHFRSVTILFSADGTGDSFEYARFPAKWETFENTIRAATEYQEQNIINWIGVAYTVSAYSIHNVIDSLRFYKEVGVPVWFNLVNEDEFRSALLPEPVKAEIAQHIQDNWDPNFLLTDDIDYNYFHAELNREVEDKWRDVFIDKTRRRDQYRGVDFTEILPGVKAWFDEK